MARRLDTSAAGSALCTACGMCCDGTLFGGIPLQDADLPLAARSSTGIVERNGRAAAAQPCGFLDGFTCTVYPLRYHACRQFRCNLLDARAAERTEQSTALEHIAAARRLRDGVTAAATTAGVTGAMPAIRMAVREWRRQRALPLDPAMAALDLRLIALENHLARHFAERRPLSPLPAASIAAKAACRE